MDAFVARMVRIFLPFLICAASTASAATQVPPAQGAAISPPSTPVLMLPLPEIKGVVSWDTLAKVKQVKSKDRIRPEFTTEITALNDQDVKLQGFMMPLEPGEKQQHFLISVNPQSCSYCLPAGPEGVVEVRTKTAVKYTIEPIILSGRMTVLKDDPMGLYYRLTDAAPASAK